MNDNLIRDWCKSANFSERTSEWHNKQNSESMIHRQGAFNRLDLSTYLPAGRWRSSWRRNQMQASIMLVGRTRNRTVQQLEHVCGRTRIASQLVDEIRKFCQATLQWINSGVGASKSSTRYPLSERIYCGTDNPCKESQLSSRAQ